MRTESAFINSLIANGVLRVEGSLDSYRITFADNKKYFCDLNGKTGQMHIRTATGTSRYFPRDIIDDHRAEFDNQPPTVGHCKLALMTFSDGPGNIYSRHTFYALLHDGQKDEYNVNRRLPAYQKKLMPQPWYTQNPTRLTLISISRDTNFLNDSDPGQTNADVKRSSKTFRHAAIIPVNTVVAAHIYMDSEIDSRTGIRYHLLGDKAQNCTTHMENILRRYGVELSEIGKYTGIPNSLLLRNKFESLQMAGEQPLARLSIEVNGGLHEIQFYQQGNTTFIDASKLYNQAILTKNKPPEERFSYEIGGFVQMLERNGIKIGATGLSKTEHQISSGQNDASALKYAALAARKNAGVPEPTR